VSVCLSKGLGAPVGSLLAGPADLIKKALRFRNSIGGGMRQAGILAAAGLYALAHHRKRLVDDHKRARALADVIAGLPGFELDPTHVETNIVLFRVISRPVAEVVATLRAEGIWIAPFGPGQVRAVVHLDISQNDIEFTIQALRRLFSTP
jgi:threonine aldolase